MSPRRSLRGRRLAVARDFRWFSPGVLLYWTPVLILNLM
eukprot:COSAG02_NODE_40772_length_401_cov_1.377483_1_plen_38_part_01